MNYVAPERTQTHTFNVKITDNLKYRKLCKMPNNTVTYLYVAVALILVAVTTFITTWENPMALVTIMFIAIGLFVVMEFRKTQSNKIFESNRLIVTFAVANLIGKVDALMEPLANPNSPYHSLNHSMLRSAEKAANSYQYDLKNEKKHREGIVSSTYEKTEYGVKRTQDGATIVFNIISDNEFSIVVKLP